MNGFSHCDQHNGGIYGVFIGGAVVSVTVQVRVKTRVPWRQHNIEGRQRDCGNGDVVEAGAGNVDKNTGVDLCCEVVAERGPIQGDPFGGDGKLAYK